MTTQDELLAEIKSTRAATKATESAMTAFECRLNVTLPCGRRSSSEASRPPSCR